MARRIPGIFVPCDVNLTSDPAIMAAGPMAELVFRRANEYVKKNHRDGQVLTHDLPVIAIGIPSPAKLAARLVDVGLWEKNPKGWLIRSYLKWNLSEAEQAEERVQKRVGAAKTNHKKGLHKEEPDPICPQCQEVGGAVLRAL